MTARGTAVLILTALIFASVLLECGAEGEVETKEQLGGVKVDDVSSNLADPEGKAVKASEVTSANKAGEKAGEDGPDENGNGGEGNDDGLDGAARARDMAANAKKYVEEMRQNSGETSEQNMARVKKAVEQVKAAESAATTPDQPPHSNDRSDYKKEKEAQQKRTMEDATYRQAQLEKRQKEMAEEAARRQEFAENAEKERKRAGHTDTEINIVTPHNGHVHVQHIDIESGNNPEKDETKPKYYPINVHPKGPHRHDPKDEKRAANMAFILFGFMIVAQCALYYWKHKSPRTYHDVTLLGLWIVPAVISTMNLYLRFMLIWAIYTLYTGRLLWKATRKPLEKNTPKDVYSFFVILYKLSYFLGVAGYIVLMLETFGVTHAFFGHIHLAPHALLMVFYGAYYGVMARDCAEMCSDRMASTMGYRSNKDELAVRHLDPNSCGVCGQRLPAPNDDGKSEGVVQLSCKHSFHDLCIRGWTIVGKKDTCPGCNEKVNLKKAFHNPWESQNLVWAQLLDVMRYLVVWNPVLMLGAQFFLWEVGLAPATPPPADQQAAAQAIAQ